MFALCQCRCPQRVYLPFSLSKQHWLRKIRQQTTPTAVTAPVAASVALSRSQVFDKLLSGPVLSELPGLVTALDELTFPAQRVSAWAAVLMSAASAAAAAAAAAGAGTQAGVAAQQQELVRLWRDDAWPDVVGRFLDSAKAAGVFCVCCISVCVAALGKL
jgi:hypothetical protein